jgi:hypothetical protein
MGVKVWSDTTVEFESAAATAIVITNITNANPAVLTHGGTDPTNGDFVLLPATAGMPNLDSRIARVAAAGVGTFELEGIDSTNIGTFTSGTFQVLTFGTVASTFADVSPSGGSAIKEDVSTIHNSQLIEIRTGTEPFSIEFTSQFNLASAALLALQALSEANSNASVKITFGDGDIITFYGGVTATLIPGGSARSLVSTPVTVDAVGLLTAYAGA